MVATLSTQTLEPPELFRRVHVPPMSKLLSVSPLWWGAPVHVSLLKALFRSPLVLPPEDVPTLRDRGPLCVCTCES